MKICRLIQLFFWFICLSVTALGEDLPSKLSLPSGMTYTSENPELQFSYFNTYDRPPDEKDAVANDPLPQSTTTFVYAKIQLKNLLYQVQDKEYTLTYKFILESGEQFGEVSLNFLIKKEWEYAWYSGSWGWDKPGRWPAGTHRVEMWINDTKFAVREFSIQENGEATHKVTTPYGPYYTHEDHQLKLHSFNTYNLPPKEKGAIANEPLPQATTSQVYVEVEVQNLLYQVKDKSYTFTYKYYFEDGQLLGEFKLDFLVKKEWEYAWYMGKGGWKEPGHWPSGTHKVEFWINNTLFAIKEFTITTDNE